MGTIELNGEVKLECARRFSRLLVEKLGDRVHKVVLFGSVAKGRACEHSDIDILVVVDRLDEEVHRVLADISFNIGVETGEGIEYMAMGIEEYMAKKAQ
ncbi:MAG: nucleotidyltransferase domain-containing protein [Candidatus Freyarchaeota archaeon]